MGKGINGSGEVLIVYLQGCRALSEFLLEAMHGIYLKILSKQLRVKSSNCFILETIGEVGKLREEEREERNLEEPQGRQRPEYWHQELDSGRLAQTSARYLPQVADSFQCSAVIAFLWEELTKGAILTFAARSCPHSLGEQGASQRGDSSSLV